MSTPSSRSPSPPPVGSGAGLAEVCAYLYALRQPPKHPGLPRVRRFLDRVGLSASGLPSVQVVGTNGKGSVSLLLASVLRKAGVRGGLFTSPHLDCVTERIMIDGRPITPKRFLDLYAALRPVLADGDAEPVGFFEILFALALLAFQREGCGVAVLEAGIGGGLDPSAVTAPEVVVLTSVARDHVDVLGPTLHDILRAKIAAAGAGSTLLSAVRDPTLRAIVTEECATRGLHLLAVDDAYGYDPVPTTAAGCSITVWLRDPVLVRAGLRVPLLGEHQAGNAALALASAHALCARLGVPFPTAAAINEAWSGTRLPGRFELVRSEGGQYLLDIAHNPEALEALAAAIRSRKREQRWDRVLLVLGIADGKPVDDLIRALLAPAPNHAPLWDHLVLTRAKWRGCDPGALAEAVEALAPQVGISITSAVDEALEIASALRTKSGDGCDTLICVTGSTFVVAEARTALGVRTEPRW